MWLEHGPAESPDSIFEGPAPAFRPSPARSTLAASRTLADPVRSGGLLFARRRALVPPCSVPRPCRQDASNPLLQPTFHVTSTRWKHPLQRLPAERRGKPANVRLRDRSSLFGYRLVVRAAPDHLAVIRPPTAARLTARLPASGLSTTSFREGISRLAPARPSPCGGEAPGRFLPRCLCRLGPSDTSSQQPNRDPRVASRPCFARLTLLLPTHVNAPTSAKSRCLPSCETFRRSSFEPRRGALPWLAGQG